MPLLPSARRTSRGVAVGALAASALLSRRPPGGRAQQAVVLGALALGMPHGAADTELLRAAAGGSRRRHRALVLGYSALAAAATVVVRWGGRGVETAVLLGSAAHFAEGELACWKAAPAGAPRARAVLRPLAAGVATLGLPAAVGTANGRPREVGVTGSLAGPERPTRAAGERTGWALPAAEAIRAVEALVP